ncbi:hypothetical protein PBI_AN9_46 [Mycobacterium phage AN9]|nr:hypothetical protein PBI_VC3_46 [Mycobacterium phage VC3]QJD52509.1 hypothetical protein PBI_ANI8_46 [Mycobacterium phage ANI8]QJD52601.1 hypothetical protein PBI_AN9_46 [Mycobacterium phage AN9]BBC43602.1 hypothetical protein [Mycobacterium phage C3]
MEELNVVFVLSRELFDRGDITDIILTKAREAAGDKASEVDNGTIRWTAWTYGSLNFGTKEEPLRIDLYERNLVAVHVTMMARKKEN